MTQSQAGTRKKSVLERLYVGNGAFDIVGKRKRGYLILGSVLLISVLLVVLRGFNFGIEFEGGTQIQLPAKSAAGEISVQSAERAVAAVLPGGAEEVQSVGTGETASIQIRTETLPQSEVDKIKDSLFNSLHPVNNAGQADHNSISDSAVSASWGNEISQKALLGLAIFLVLVAIFLTFYFEKWMAVAALLALGFDLLSTAGVYSLVGFEVTPASVIGLLTILGFSLYDTVVVFDKVKENTRGLLGLTRRTYAETANLALNQTLMRSINTSVIALLPVLGLLIVGVGLLGVGTLADLALVQMVGMLSGAISSIFLATPLLVDMKMTERPYQEQERRVLNRRANQRRKAEADQADAGDDAESDVETTTELSLGEEQRREQAMAAAASAPARTGKQADSARRGQQTQKQQQQKQQQQKRQPSTKRQAGGRPSGKRRR
jgi:preprotein translocase subunit SecF